MLQMTLDWVCHPVCCAI